MYSFILKEKGLSPEEIQIKLGDIQKDKFSELELQKKLVNLEAEIL